MAITEGAAQADLEVREQAADANARAASQARAAARLLHEAGCTLERAADGFEAIANALRLRH